MSWLIPITALIVVLGAGMLLAYKAGSKSKLADNQKEQLKDIRDAKDARDRYATDPEYRKRVQDDFRR